MMGVLFSLNSLVFLLPQADVSPGEPLETISLFIEQELVGVSLPSIEVIEVSL